MLLVKWYLVGLVTSILLGSTKETKTDRTAYLKASVVPGYNLVPVVIETIDLVVDSAALALNSIYAKAKSLEKSTSKKIKKAAQYKMKQLSKMYYKGAK